MKCDVEGCEGTKRQARMRTGQVPYWYCPSCRGRRQYERTAVKSGFWTVKGFKPGRAMDATKSQPGSDSKVEVMRQRVLQGTELNHPGDLNFRNR